jgi:transcriptional regulator with XRE-family HTH domain
MPQTHSSDTGKALRHGREQLGWKQEEFAEKAGVAPGTVRNAERGKRIRPNTHRDLILTLNKWLALQDPPKPPVDIPYPCDERSPESSAPSGSVIRHTESPLDNPHLSAIHEALRHIEPFCSEDQIRLGSIRSPAELRDLWAIDNTAYGDSNITFEHFLALWKAFPLGLRVLFFENQIMGAMGIWPVSSRWAEDLKSAHLEEADLDSRMVGRCARKPVRYWYVTGIVLRQQLIGTRGIKRLLRDGLNSWLTAAKIQFPCEILALAYSDYGRRLLERFSFFRIQDESIMPDKCGLYGLQIGSRAELVELLRKRQLDVTRPGS